MQKTKRKICIITGSRAEYGLLYPLMKEIKKDHSLILKIIATGTHLEKKYGNTYNQIEKDGFRIDSKVYMSLKSDKDREIISSCSMALKGFGNTLNILSPDIIVLLGDRFEILMAAVAATIMRIPIAHIHGGEVTLGAYDDAIRHAITKMSYLHFVAHEGYRKRVIQLGEEPKRVFNFGAPGLDNIRSLKLLDKQSLEKQIGFKIDDKTAIVTFHPSTLEKGQAIFQVTNLIEALSETDLRIIFTLPNADQENSIISNKINSFIRRNLERSKMFQSLGNLRYLSLMKYAKVMIGNSSSGIIEAASFKLPVVNIGCRQNGRIRPKNVIETDYKKSSIKRGINRATSAAFADSLKDLENPFGNGEASIKIKKKLKSIDLSNIQKKFYDLRAV